MGGQVLKVYVVGTQCLKWWWSPFIIVPCHLWPITRWKDYAIEKANMCSHSRGGTIPKKNYFKNVYLFIRFARWLSMWCFDWKKLDFKLKEFLTIIFYTLLSNHHHQCYTSPYFWIYSCNLLQPTSDSHHFMLINATDPC